MGVHNLTIFVPHAQQSWRGVYCFHLVRLSVRLLFLGWLCGLISCMWDASRKNHLWFSQSSHFMDRQMHKVIPGVCLSVCQSLDRIRSVSSTILAGSISYLHILLTNFREWVMCWVLWKIPKFEFLAISLNLHLWLCLVHQFLLQHLLIF